MHACITQRLKPWGDRGGELIQPPYTNVVSTTLIIEEIIKRYGGEKTK